MSMPSVDQIRELVRQTDYAAVLTDPREPASYAEEVLVTQRPGATEWLVTARRKELINRYVVRQELRVTPVASFGDPW
jgi:hypothetical protein